jgi:hypothetical protein
MAAPENVLMAKWRIFRDDAYSRMARNTASLQPGALDRRGDRKTKGAVATVIKSVSTDYHHRNPHVGGTFDAWMDQLMSSGSLPAGALSHLMR